MNNILIASCGLDCEKCDAYIATVNDDNALREKTAQLWSQLNDAPITKEMINCMGCRTDGVKTPFCDSMCEIRNCVKDKGFDSCGECSEMEPCSKLKFVFDNNTEAANNLKSLMPE